MEPNIIDITPALHAGIGVWEGDTPFQLGMTLDREKGAPWTCGSVHMSLHTGAHADAPWHYLPEGQRIHEVSLEKYIGRATVFTIGGGGPIGPKELMPILDFHPERLLIRSDPNRDFGMIPETFSYFTEPAARMLVETKLNLVGIDSPSVDDPALSVLKVHRILGEAGIAILENLDLSKAVDGDYELIALPLKIEMGDASPVRAILRNLS